MKKSLVATLLAVSMVFSLVACGGSSSGGNSAPAAPAADSSASSSDDAAPAADDSGSSDAAEAPAASGDALEVVIWDTNQQPGIQQICDEFTAKTGIACDVQVKDWNSYWTLLEAGATGGTLPDIFWMHSNNSQMYMKNEMLLNLDDYIAGSSVVDLANYMPEITALYTMNGHQYAIPKDYDTIALWYNKTMFDEAGIAYPDATWTYDDMYEAAKKLTKADGSQYGFAMRSGDDQAGYYNMVYSHGGYVLSDDKKSSGYDNEKTLEMMDLTAKIVKDCCPPAATMAETGTDVLIESGTVAMCMQGSWMTAAFMANEYMAANCDVAILPYDKTTGERASICNGLGWAAAANTDRPDDCWALLEWFGSKEMQLKQADLGVTMSAYNNTSDNWVNCTDLFDLHAYLDMTKPTAGDAKNKLILRPFTYNSSVWTFGAEETLAAAWENPDIMRDTCIAYAQTMNDYIAAENN